MREAVSFLLAPLWLVACSERCDAEPHPFSIDDDLSSAQIDSALVANGLDDPADLTCEELCAAAADGAYAPSDVETCSYVPTATPTDTGAAAIAGHVSCSGEQTLLCL